MLAIGQITNWIDQSLRTLEIHESQSTLFWVIFSMLLNLLLIIKREKIFLFDDLPWTIAKLRHYVAIVKAIDFIKSEDSGLENVYAVIYYVIIKLDFTK